MTKTEDINKNSFDQDFCSYLEFHLSKTFKNSDDRNLRALWCDGIVHTKSTILNSGQLETKAWIGRDGQEQYEMTIKFGPDSLSKFAKGLDLTATVPSDNSMDWINIDIHNKTIELQLT
jgi:hypothetical protein